MTRPRLVATYRLQLTPAFGFAAARNLLGHLEGLRVSHVYLSPILEAKPGSLHGYDGIDPRAVRRELGGETEFRRLAAAAHRRGLGVVVDVVPNHLAASASGTPFRDVLARGEKSRFARWFDIDWTRTGSDGRRAVVLPWLPCPVAELIASGEIVVAKERGRIVLRFGTERLPLTGAAVRPRGAAALERLLARQHYRLVLWRRAGGPRNFRRYLDLDELIALRIEDDAVFDATHAKVIELAHAGCIDGLRLDHLDGLSDPERYLARLRGALPAGVHLFAETTACGSDLPCGTTGYDFLGSLMRDLAPPEAAQAMDAAFAAIDARFDATAARRGSRRHAARVLLKREVAAVAASVAARAGIREGLVRSALVAQLELERAASSRAHVAVSDALKSDPAARRLASYVHAKGIEDTLFWRDVRWLARSELGVSPGFGDRQDGVPAVQRGESSASWPSLLATSTHDTKRSEDVRARLLALAPRAREFASVVDSCVKRLRRDRAVPDPVRRLARADVWFLLQELVASWPNQPMTARELDDYIVRLERHVEKAAREAKLRSSWTDPDLAYERALQRFVRWCVVDQEDERSDWSLEFAALRREVARAGAFVSLTQVVLKCTAPGVPDFYQGCELPAFSLVDPDNRRPVDWSASSARVAALDRLERGTRGTDREALIERLACEVENGFAKLLVTRECLALRHESPELFAAGSGARVEQVAMDGVVQGAIIAFERSHGDRRVVVLARRLLRGSRAGIDAAATATLAGPLRSATSWRERFTGRSYPTLEGRSLASLLTPLGFALIENERAGRRGDSR